MNRQRYKLHKTRFFDYASTTPLDKKVFKKMRQYMYSNFFNPSAIYTDGVAMRDVVESVRTNIARILHVRPNEVVFTGSGTESNNLALLGLLHSSGVKKPHIITTTIEHPAIFEVTKYIEENGGEVTYIPVNEEGLLDSKDIAAALKKNTICVSVMYANNEIGTVQPLRAIAREIRKWKEKEGREREELPYFHSDAAQAPNYLDCSIEKLGVDMMTLDSSKFYGPKGVGCLVKKYYVGLQPIVFGGGQESGLRPGTENVPGIVGFGAALEQAVELREKEIARLKQLQTYFISRLYEELPQASLNGSVGQRLPNNVNICIPGVNAEFLVIQLDEKGIACASMTACKNLNDKSLSFVVDALGKEGCASSSLRFSMGRGTKKRDVDYLIDTLKRVIV